MIEELLGRRPLFESLLERFWPCVVDLFELGLRCCRPVFQLAVFATLTHQLRLGLPFPAYGKFGPQYTRDS